MTWGHFYDVGDTDFLKKTQVLQVLFVVCHKSTCKSSIFLELVDHLYHSPYP